MTFHWKLTVATLGWVAGFCLLGSAQQAENLPDLAVVALSLSPEAPKPLTLATVSVTVENRGAGPAGAFRVGFTVGTQLTKPLDGLAPGASVTVRFSWFGTEGAHTLRAEADPFGQVAESDEANNGLERVVEVRPDPLPDLTIERISLRPENPLPREPTTIEVVVKNVGTLAPAGRAVLRVQDDLGTLGTLFVEPLAPNMEVTFTVNWSPQQGQRRLQVEIDALGRIPELREDNNLLTQIVTVSPNRPSGAQLSVRVLEVAPDSPAEGQPTTLRAVVANEGTGEATDVALLFQVDGRTLKVVTLSRIPVGAQLGVGVTWVPDAQGERVVRAKIDSGGVVAEANEADNVAARFVQVGGSPNACSQQVWLDLEPEAGQILGRVLLLSEEEIAHEFMPQLKLAMEDDFAGVNIRFFLNRPVGLHSRLTFIADPPPDARLGQAVLDFNNRNHGDGGLVYVAGFESGLARGQAFARGLDSLAQAIAKVASHEAGHFLGLEHDDATTTQAFGGRNLMAPSVDTLTGSLFADAFFTDANLAYLRQILPLACGG